MMTSLNEVIQEIEAKIASALTAMDDELDGHRQKAGVSENGPPPSELHHSTSAEGLIGILSSGKIWATDSFRLNDPEEIDYARQIVLEVIQERIPHHDGVTKRALLGFPRERSFPA